MLPVHTLPLGLHPASCSDVVSEPLVSAELKEWFQCSMVVFLSLVPLQLFERDEGEGGVPHPEALSAELGIGVVG